MPVWLTLGLARKAGPYLAIAAACLAAYLWIHGMQATIARQARQLSDLSVQLIAEQQARKADVAGLTTLAQGTAAAAVVTKRDATILSETIDAKNPAPASPGLSAYLAKLRAADTASAVHSAGSTGGSATR